jgi:folate-binding Fe-S cluster repair protein YgfZ
MGTPLPPPSGYEALRSAVAWANLGQRSTLTARGRDAVRFIDNFTTAAVAPLAAGQGTEGFSPMPVGGC